MSPSQDKRSQNRNSQDQNSQDRTGKTALSVPVRILAVFFVLLLVVVLALELMSWNFLKDPITERVTTATDREMAIGGDISVSLFPRPHIELQNLAFANADWAQAPNMVRVDRIELTPSLSDLITGALVLDDIEIEGLVVNLENREQQPGNWILPAMISSEGQQQGSVDDAGAVVAEEGGNAADESSLPFVIRQFQLTDTEISYRAAGMAEPHVLSLASLKFIDDRLTLQATADLNVGDGREQLPAELSAGVVTGFSDNHWQLNDIEARLDATRLSGQIGWNGGVQPPLVTAQLHSPEINGTEILAMLPESSDSSDQLQLSIPVLPDLAGDIRVTVAQLTLEPAIFNDLEAHLITDPQQLTLETLRFAVAEGEVQATANLTSNADFVAAQTDIQVQGIDLHTFGIGQQTGQNLNADIVASLGRMEQAPSFDAAMLLEHLVIDVARASYQTEGSDADTELELILQETGEPPVPVLSVTGQFQDNPFDMRIEGAPLSNLTDGLAGYRLHGQAQSGDLFARVDTRLGALLSPETFAADLVLEGASGQGLEDWLGPVLPPLPEFRIAGRVSREQEQWSVTSLEGSIGVTELRGKLHYLPGDRPRVEADLEAGRIELAQFMGTEQSADSDDADSDTGAGMDEPDTDSPLAVLRTFDARLNLQVETLVLPDSPALTELQLVATLESGDVGVEPLDFRVAGGSWNSAIALNASTEPVSGAIDAEFDDIGLSRFGDTFTAIEDRLGTMSGELHLEITESLATEQVEDLLLPFIGRLAVQPSWLSFTDHEADTAMRLEMDTRGLDAGEQAFHIDGEGRYDGAPFSLRFRGDRLLDAREPELPYNMDFSADVVDTHLELTGSVLRPLVLSGLNLQLAVEGPSPHRLSGLLGLPLPELPPYSVSGDLDLDGQRWSLTDINGAVGDSDLNGRLALDSGVRPPQISGELQSDTLDIADLGVLVGAESDPETETGEEQASDKNARQFILPSEPVVTSAWQDISVDIRYQGESVRAADIPLSDVLIEFSLADGHGHFNPVRFGVGDGRVDFNLDLDSRPEVPEGTLQLEVRSVNLQKALSEWSMAEDSVGTVGGQGKFWLKGASVAELLGSADGGMVILMRDGKLDALLVELAGLDVAQAFSSWVSNRDAIPIGCSYLDLQSRDGVATIDTLAIDTEDTRFSGTGTVNMNTETVDVTVHAYPKDFSVLSVNAPLHLRGTFADLEPDLPAGDIGLQVVASAALAAVAAPVAALIPLLDLGSGEGSPYCNGLASRTLEAIGDAE